MRNDVFLHTIANFTLFLLIRCTHAEAEPPGKARSVSSGNWEGKMDKKYAKSCRKVCVIFPSPFPSFLPLPGKVPLHHG